MGEEREEVKCVNARPDPTPHLLGLRTKLEILAGYALRAAKRIFGIPDFRYYALADGIKSIFARSGRGFRSGDAKDPPIEQLFLFV